MNKNTKEGMNFAIIGTGIVAALIILATIAGSFTMPTSAMTMQKGNQTMMNKNMTSGGNMTSGNMTGTSGGMMAKNMTK
jgi:hypothetical protein